MVDKQCKDGFSCFIPTGTILGECEPINDFGGCVSTEYGCCPHSKLARVNAKGSNCKNGAICKYGGDAACTAECATEGHFHGGWCDSTGTCQCKAAIDKNEVFSPPNVLKEIAQRTMDVPVYTSWKNLTLRVVSTGSTGTYPILEKDINSTLKTVIPEKYQKELLDNVEYSMSSKYSNNSGSFSSHTISSSELHAEQYNFGYAYLKFNGMYELSVFSITSVAHLLPEIKYSPQWSNHVSNLLLHDSYEYFLSMWKN